MADADADGMCRDAGEILGERQTLLPSGLVPEVALEAGLSTYDAEFVALARRLQSSLLTVLETIGEAAPYVTVPL